MYTSFIHLSATLKPMSSKIRPTLRARAAGLPDILPQVNQAARPRGSPTRARGMLPESSVNSSMLSLTSLCHKSLLPERPQRKRLLDFELETNSWRAKPPPCAAFASLLLQLTVLGRLCTFTLFPPRLPETPSGSSRSV